MATNRAGNYPNSTSSKWYNKSEDHIQAGSHLLRGILSCEQPFNNMEYS
jgi:hypothetical protein